MKTTLAAIALMALPATGVAQEPPKVKILDVLGAGTGCPVDETGKPADWDVNINEDHSAVDVEFSSFVVTPEFKTTNCNLRVWVSVPQGYKAFTYVSQFGGAAQTTATDYGIFAATMSVGDTEYPPISHTIRSNMDDEDWETTSYKSPIKVEIPCGGDLVKLNYQLSLTLLGKESEIQLINKKGSFDGIKFEIKKCD